MMLYYLSIATRFGGVFDIVIDRSVNREMSQYNNEHLTISPVAAWCNGAYGKKSSIECIHIDAGARNHGDGV